MPAPYAHTIFGKDVLQKLDQPTKELIYQYIDYYYIGLFGPDILFYNQPLKKNKINQYGYHLHEIDAYNFFKHAKEVLKETPYPKQTLVYIYGFINHFILDSECHGYIGQIEKQTHLSHATIESDFERALLQQNNEHASGYHLLKHVHYTKDMASIIAPIFQLEPKDIDQSLKGMHFFLELLRCPRNLKRNILKYGMKIVHVYESMYGLIIQDEPHPLAIQSTKHLIELKNNAIDIAIKEINQFQLHLNDDELSDRFHRTFE